MHRIKDAVGNVDRFDPKVFGRARERDALLPIGRGNHDRPAAPGLLDRTGEMSLSPQQKALREENVGGESSDAGDAQRGQVESPQIDRIARRHIIFTVSGWIEQGVDRHSGDQAGFLRNRRIGLSGIFPFHGRRDRQERIDLDARDGERTPGGPSGSATAPTAPDQQHQQHCGDRRARKVQGTLSESWGSERHQEQLSLQ